MRRLIKLSGFLFAVIIVQSLAAYTKRPVAQPLLIADQLKIIKSIDKQNRLEQLYVPVKIYNLGTEPLKFWIMDCSVNEFFETDNKYLNIPRVLCYKNSPIMITLAPGQSYNLRLPIVFKQNNVAAHTAFKISMSLLEDEKYHLYKDNLEMYTRSNLIWSNEIQIP